MYVSQLHSCAAVVWTGSQVDANTLNLIPWQTKTIETIKTKIGTIDYVVRFYKSAKLDEDCHFRLAPT